MKNFFIILLTVGCAVVLFLGNQQWRERVQVKSKTSGTVLAEEKGHKKEDFVKDNDSLLGYVENWPEDAQENFKAALEDGKPYKILLTGSPALGSESDGWASMLKDELEAVYGDAIAVKIKIYDLTSLQMVEEEKYEELAAEQADLILLEPFILNDNGKVGNDQAAENLSVVIESIQNGKTDSNVILQPANPLSKAKYYPLQVEALKEYAETNGLTYINHWEAWPETEIERRALLSLGDPSFPNEEGHKLWADHLTNYFISK